MPGIGRRHIYIHAYIYLPNTYTYIHTYTYLIHTHTHIHTCIQSTHNMEIETELTCVYVNEKRYRHLK